MEKWKDIVGWEGYYQVSSVGRIKSLERKTISRGVKECVRKLHIQNSGYLTVGLFKENKGQQFLVHRLMALAFIKNTEKLDFVNHKNGIKTDNRIENLEWCTKGYNLKHAYDNGLKTISQKQLNRIVGWNKNEHSVKVNQYSKQGELVAFFNSMTEAAFKTGLNYNSIVDCVRGRHKTCGGFVFKPV
jgi:hypothetical protein